MEETEDASMESPIVVTETQNNKDQYQDDIEYTQCKEVGQESTEDYTNLFMTSRVFESKDALVEWVRSVGKENNMVIVTQRSDSGIIGNKKKRPKVELCCERGGYFRRILKSDAHSEKSQKQTDGDGKKKKRPKASGTKKCGCRFALRGINNTGDEWTLKVICGVHNHPSSQSLHGHSYAGRLSKEEHAMLVNMSTSLMKPKDILTAIKKRDRENVTILKTIYNARSTYRTKAMAGRSQMQCLLHKLREHNYIEHHRSKDNVITDLFWCHPYCLEILRTFPYVLIMDCTYKTNKYCFPLFEIVGVTCTEKTFNVAFVYMSKEAEDNYTWALSRLKTLLHDDYGPGVIVTDRELALMNNISKIFPDSRHLLCKWHINKNVMKECKKKFPAKTGGWETFIDAWNTVVSSSTEGEYLKNLQQLESKFSTYPTALDYVNKNWLNKYKELFVAAWTDTCMHLGTTTSNRVESAHSRLKRQLRSSQLDFNVSWDYIHSLMELHHTDIKASFERSRCFLQHDFKHDYLKELISYVSITALNKIVCEANRAVDIKDLAGCACAIRVTHGLPCAHEIAEYRHSNKPIPIDAVHKHWRQLGVGQTMHTSDPQEKVPVNQHMVRLEKWVQQQNDETRREFLIKIDELMNPGSTFLKEPAERVKTKGRPPVDTSTRRFPSAWEIDNVLSSQDNDSAPTVYEVGQDVPHGPVVPVRPTTSDKKPKDGPNKVQGSNGSPFTTLTTKYNCQFRLGMQPYIIGAFDVESDGNCGYRVVASAMGFGRKSWRRVRKDLLNELDNMPQLYEVIFGTGHVKRVRDALDYYGSGFAPIRRWMCFPEMGHLIATCYGVVVINISYGQCITYLPLVEHHTGHLSSNDIKEIGIGHVNNNHYVNLQMSPGHPLPYLVPNWERNADAKVIHLYSRYQNRLEQYKECCPITVVPGIFTVE